MTQQPLDQWVQSPGQHEMAQAAVGSHVVVRRYGGKQDQALAAFQVDAAQMSRAGWFPTGQQYIPGSWGAGVFLLAVLLFVFVLGILILVYLVLVKPDGTLVVTYEYRGQVAPPAETFEGWVRRVGATAARASLETDLRNQDITRTDYAARISAIDALNLG